MAALPQAQSDLAYERRHEEQCHEEAHGEVDDHHGYEVLKIEAHLLLEEEHDAESADSGERGSHDGGERTQITLVRYMVGHDYDIVDYEVERDGDARQRVKLYLNAEKIVEDHSYGEVDHKRDGDHHHVAEIERDERDESKQDDKRQPGTEIYLRQLALDLLGGVVSHAHLVAPGHVGAQRLHACPYLLGEFQLIGILLRPDCDIDGVEPVDAVVALRRSLLIGDIHKARKRYEDSVGCADGDRVGIERG